MMDVDERWRSGSPRRGTGGPHPALVRRLGEGARLGAGGPLAALDALARSGVPVLEGLVLTQRAHEEFLRGSGLLEAIRASGATGELPLRALLLRRAYASAPVGEVMHELITEALIGLGARSVCVLSEDGAWRGLGTIPDVRDAVRDAWISVGGLERQVRAAAAPRGAPTTWPVLIQREVHPEHVGWSLAGSEKPGALYDVRPVRSDVPPARGIAELTREAGAVLDGPVRLLWGLEGETWYVLGVERE